MESKWAMANWFIAAYKERWEVLARRKESYDYARYWETPVYRFNETMVSKCGKNFCRERHTAVNFTNSDTIEFRIFKGTLKYTTVMATLEMVHALVGFIKGFRVAPILKHEKTMWSLYINYIANHRDLYYHAEEYIKNRHLWDVA